MGKPTSFFRKNMNLFKVYSRAEICCFKLVLRDVPLVMVNIKTVRESFPKMLQTLEDCVVPEFHSPLTLILQEARSSLKVNASDNELVNKSHLGRYPIICEALVLSEGSRYC